MIRLLCAATVLICTVSAPYISSQANSSWANTTQAIRTGLVNAGGLFAPVSGGLFAHPESIGFLDADSQKCIPIWPHHSAECIPSATNGVAIGYPYPKTHTKTSIGALSATALAVSSGGLMAEPRPSEPDSAAYKWHTSLATFFAWRQWGYGVPPSQKIPGGRSGHFACGGRYLRSTIAVAHRTLPCGTIVRFCHNKVCLNVPVRDRFGGSGFDLTSEAAIRLNHVFTGPIKWRVLP